MFDLLAGLCPRERVRLAGAAGGTAVPPAAAPPQIVEVLEPFWSSLEARSGARLCGQLEQLPEPRLAGFLPPAASS